MFYAMKDLAEKVQKDAEALACNMEICDVIYAAERIRKGGKKNG